MAGKREIAVETASGRGRAACGQLGRKFRSRIAWTRRTEPSSVADIAYGRLRADILGGALPPGMKLKLEALRERYDVSINTLRETLSRLAADGLVEAEGQRGFTVMPASLADLIDITETRRLLECHAARLSVERADLEWELRLVAAYHKLSQGRGTGGAGCRQARGRCSRPTTANSTAR